MPHQESQHIEWKETWREELLKWICGFANAEGGSLHIGRNNRGAIVGVPEAETLLETLPNQIRDLLGILVPVNLHHEDGNAWLEIVTPPYPSPINYRGHYYQRCGSTNQELKGAALDRFLMSRYGRTWDSAPIPGVEADDLSPAAVQTFRELASKSGRLTPADLRVSTATLLNRLKLTEGDYLKRAAILLFHEDPERFVTGAFVKIGFFRSESDLAYHDLVQGSLFAQVAQTVDLLRTKYLKAAIHYAGLQRIETFPVPYDALREAVLNALVHRDYGVTPPVQIRVYEDRLVLWNPAVLPDGWTQQTLVAPHVSHPYNPDIANTFFRAGEIEAWGRGIERIFAACRKAGTPKPKLRLDAGGIWTEFTFGPNYLKAISTPASVAEDNNLGRGKKWGEKWGGKWGGKILLRRQQIAQLMLDNPKISTLELATALKMSTSGVEKHLSALREVGLIRRIGPAKGGHWEVIL
jgi:ATP-dependent DNA helicase RecG